MKFIESAKKLKKLYGISIALSVFWLLFLILFSVFSTIAAASAIYDDVTTLQGYQAAASAFVIIFVISLLANIVVLIICLVKSLTLENKNDTNVLISSDFTTLKVISILSIFFGGLLLSIISYFVVKGLIDRANNGPVTNVTGSTTTNNVTTNNPNNNSNGNSEDKVSKVTQAADLYKQGLITEEEYKKIKEETLG